MVGTGASIDRTTQQSGSCEKIFISHHQLPFARFV